MIVNLSDTVNEVSNSYTYYLEEKLQKLYAQMMSDKVSVEGMKRNVYGYIWPAAYSYRSKGKTVFTKKKWFQEELERLETKKQIYFLCLNSVRRARATLAKR